MRLINPNDMVRALRHGAVRPWEYLIYGTLWVVGSTLSVWGLFTSDYSSNLLKYVDLLVLAGILGGGTLFAWQINKKGDGEHFWRRYFSIDISLVFSVLIFVAVTSFLYSLTRALMDGGAYFEKTFIDVPDVMFGAIGQLIFLVWSLSLMCKVSLPTKEAVTEEMYAGSK